MGCERITRKEFLKMTGFGAFAIFILPGLKRLGLFKMVYREARYYENLAG